MAALTENNLKTEIQKGKFREFYVLVGEDPFRPDFYAEQLASAVLPEGGNREVFYADETDPGLLLESVKSLSLWDPVRFLLVRQAERWNARQWERLLPLLEEPFERCTLVVQATKADGRMKFFQALGKSGDRCALLKFEGGGDWNHWLRLFLQENEKEIEADAREILAEWTGSSLSELKNLVSRASLYAGGDPVIRREHILAVGFKVAPEDVFRFTSSLLQGDRSQALALLAELLRQGEEPLALVGLLARQYRWLLSILALKAEGKNDQTIASTAGIFPSAAKILFPASRRLGGKAVIRGLCALAEADHGLKSSRLPKDQQLVGLVLSLTD